MAVEMETPLKRLREELGVSREQLIRRTPSVSLGTLRNAEYGKRIAVHNVQQILDAINELRRAAEQGELTMADLGVNLY